MTALGWIVDDGCPPKRDGAAAFAARLAESPTPPAGHRQECRACDVLGEELACVGILEPKVSKDAEMSLLRRLPDDLESLPGVLLRQFLGEAHVEGKGGEALRKLGLLEAAGPFTRHWGPFFRRVTITTDQLLEGMFGAGDVEPPHALALLVHLGGILVDGEEPVTPEHGPRLGEIVGDVARRRERTASRVTASASDRSTRDLERWLRALWAGFVLDCPVRVMSPV
jgi:hypothetical protein